MLRIHLKQIQNFLESGDYATAKSFLRYIAPESQNDPDYFYYPTSAI